MARKGYWIYDFVLPYVVLETLLLGKSDLLYRILQDRPHNQFTTLDCHDGIPVMPDLDGIANIERVRQVCAICNERHSHFTRIVSEEHKGPNGFDVHQICGSFYSMLNNADAYIAARAIQFFVPGIPQLYYVGLLAGKNDEERRIKTGDNREANRHNYTIDEINSATQKPVVQRLCRLIRFRNSNCAFNGNFSFNDKNQDQVNLYWEKESEYCKLQIDLVTYQGCITYSEKGNRMSFTI